jgi:hypothetical protein
MSRKKAELSAGHMARSAAASSGSENCAATESSERGPHFRSGRRSGSMRGSSFAVPPSPMSSLGGPSAIMSRPTSLLAAPQNSRTSGASAGDSSHRPATVRSRSR